MKKRIHSVVITVTFDKPITAKDAVAEVRGLRRFRCPECNGRYEGAAGIIALSCPACAKEGRGVVCDSHPASFKVGAVSAHSRARSKALP